MIPGAYWLARDFYLLLPTKHIQFYLDELSSEVKKSEQSHLAQQILDANSSLKYEQVYEGLSLMCRFWTSLLN